MVGESIVDGSVVDESVVDDGGSGLMIVTDPATRTRNKL
jgi:hypothetical protein